MMVMYTINIYLRPISPSSSGRLRLESGTTLQCNLLLKCVRGKSSSFFLRNRQHSLVSSISGDQIPMVRRSASRRWSCSPAQADKKKSRFFKIVTSSAIQNQRLGLPPKFVKNFSNNLSNVAVLQDPSDQLWHVELRKAKGNIFFVKGWQRFVEYHSISTGHFLVFRYQGNSKFRVLIFDMGGSEISYQSVSDNNQGTNCGLFQNVNDKSHELLDGHVIKQEDIVDDVQEEMVHVPVTEMRLHTKAWHARSCQHVRVDGNGGENEARKLLEATYPFFTLIMKPAYVNQGYSILPVGFMRKYLNVDLKSITLEVSDGRKWCVGVRIYGKGSGKIGNGWSKFVKENGLKLGNICVFELIRQDVLRVHIHPGQ